MAQAIAVPHEHKPTRLPSFPNLERTAVVPGLVTTSFSVAGGVSSDILLVRSPTYPLWSVMPSTLPGDTIACRYYKSGLPNYGEFSADGDTGSFPNNFLATASYAQTGTSTQTVYYPVGMTDDGRAFVKTCSIGYNQFVFSVTNAPSTNFVFSLLVENFDGSESSYFNQEYTQALASGSEVTMTLSVNSLKPWWRPVSLTLKSHTGANLPGLITNIWCGVCGEGNLNNPTAGSLSGFFPLSTPPEFTTQPVPYSGTRANAAAVLITNTTAVMEKEGIIRAARIPRTRQSSYWWNGIVTTSDVTNYNEAINSANPADRYFGPAEKGVYTFTLPDAASERFRDYVSNVSSAPARFMLEGFDYVHLITIADKAGNGSSFAVTLDTHLEFRSSSMFYPLGFSTTSLESYHVAQMALAKQGVFYENPVHLGAIATLVRSAVTRFAPIAMPYLKGAARAAGTYLINEAVKRVSTRMPQAGFTQPRQQQTKPKPQPKPKNNKKKKTTVKRR